MKKVLITGGAGYLGQRLVTLGDAAFAVHPTFFINRILHPNAVPLDLCVSVAVHEVVQRIKPDIIIHQAISNSTPQQIESIVPAAQNIAQVCAAHHIRLIHVSSDLVFDGKHPPYPDEAAPAPVNAYGEAKARAEEIVQRALPSAVIARPSLIYGFDPLDKQTTWLVNGIKNKQIVKLFTDEYRCPIWVDNLAQLLLELAASNLSGVFNLGGPALTRWEFGQMLLAHLRLDPQGYVVPSTIKESGLQRPADLTLVCARAVNFLQTKILPFAEVLGKLD